MSEKDVTKKEKVEEEEEEGEGERSRKGDWKLDYIQLLVLSSNQYNYVKLFKDVKIDGYELRVDQCSVMDISLSTYTPTTQNPFGLNVDIRRSSNPLPETDQNKRRTIQPHFLLVRTLFRGMTTHGTRNDHRNLLFGFLNAGIPSVNTLESIYFNLERVVVHGELRKLEKRLGHENFPLIDQAYHSNYLQIMFPPGMPCVVKIGHVHAGFGKIVITDSDRLKDIGTIVALHKDYTTTEKFIEGVVYETRVQKIGRYYRCMRKKLVSGWKSNEFGTAMKEDAVVEEKHKRWLDEIGNNIYNEGMDICALDVLHDKEGKEYILELNGCAIGLSRDHEKEDLLCIKELVVQRIKERLLYCCQSKTSDIIIQNGEEVEVELINSRNEVKRLQAQLNDLKEKMGMLIPKSSSSENEKKKKKGWFGL